MPQQVAQTAQPALGRSALSTFTTSEVRNPRSRTADRPPGTRRVLVVAIAWRIVRQDTPPWRSTVKGPRRGRALELARNTGRVRLKVPHWPRSSCSYISGEARFCSPTF
jgi:hypothetical protein